MTQQESQHSSILDDLPPEKLLETSQSRLIKAGIACMDDVETVQEYVAYENQHDQRAWVCQMLQRRAAELRDDGS